MKKKDNHPLAINILKLQAYNFNFFKCEEVVLFEYFVIKGMAFKKNKNFFHSLEVIKNETGIKTHSLKTIIKKFKKIGILESEVKGMPRVNYWTIIYPKIIELLPQIYKLDENNQLLPEIEAKLNVFLLPLSENYLEKNNKKNIKSNLKENYDFVFLKKRDLFNNILSDLSFERDYSISAFKFDDQQLYKALDYYSYDELVESVQIYFKTNFQPSLKKFFKVDPLSGKKLISIENQKRKIKLEIDEISRKLNSTYEKRIEIYNGKSLIGRPYSVLVITNKIRSKIKECLKTNSDLAIINAFESYIDSVLNKEIVVKNTLDYFFTYNDNEYKVINKHLENHNLNYSY